MDVLLQIRLDDLSDPRIAAFLEDHVRDMRAVSPPESKHALDLAALRQSDIRFWSAWDGDRLVGCAALRQLDAHHGELKSMRIAPDARRGGLARQLLAHVLDAARTAALRRISLETGAMPFFCAGARVVCRARFCGVSAIWQLPC